MKFRKTAHSEGQASHQQRAASLYERMASLMDVLALFRRTLLTIASMDSGVGAEGVGGMLFTLESSVARLETEADALRALLKENDVHPAQDSSGALPGSLQDLEELIAAQREALVALRRQVSETELTLQKPTLRGGELKAALGAVEIQDVSEFLLESPIASVPVNASYYQRILEASNSSEGDKRPMGSILMAAGLISARQLESALQHQREGKKRPLGALLVDLGYTTDTAIAQTIAAQLSLPFVTLSQEVVKQDALDMVPLHLARRHACFPVSVNESALYVAMANPLDLIALEDLRLVSSKHVRPCVASREEITGHINRHYAGSVF